MKACLAFSHPAQPSAFPVAAPATIAATEGTTERLIVWVQAARVERTGAPGAKTEPTTSRAENSKDNLENTTINHFHTQEMGPSVPAASYTTYHCFRPPGRISWPISREIRSLRDGSRCRGLHRVCDPMPRLSCRSPLSLREQSLGVHLYTPQCSPGRAGLS